MNRQHLLILAAALVLLLGLRFVLDRSPTPASSLEEAGLGRVLAEGFDPSAIGWIRLTGPGAGEALELSRSETGWVVDSAHAAPAQAEEVDTFLGELASLRGETRGEAPSAAADFGVDEATAARLELGAERGSADVVLRIGKAGDSPSAHFVLREGSERIRHVASGIAGKLGLMGAAREPDPQHWVRLQLYELAPDSLTEVAVDRPDVNWRLVREPPVEVPPDETMGSGPSASSTQWRIHEPEPGWTPREGAVASFVSRLARVRAGSVLGADEEACDDGELRLRLRLSTGERDHLLRLGSRLLDGDVVAAKLDGSPTCYGLPRWTAESLLPRASRLFEVPKPLGAEPPASADFTRLDLEHDGVSIRLERDGEEWRLSRPERGPANGSRVERILSGLRLLAWDDFGLEAVLLPEAQQPHASLVAQAGDSRWSLTLLGRRDGGLDEARYARIEGGNGAPTGLVGIIAGTSVESLTPSLEELRAEPESSGS